MNSGKQFNEPFLSTVRYALVLDENVKKFEFKEAFKLEKHKIPNQVESFAMLWRTFLGQAANS